MLVLASNNHCSPAQIVKALALINTRLSTKLSKLAIQTHHYIDLKNGASELSTEDLVAVSACLDYGYGACNAEGLPWTLTVLPRPGTITPWSSKATEILALCLHPSPIQRIEHGTVWKFERELSKDEVAQIGDILYDRMTQIMVRPETPVTADILFHHEKPRLLGSVPLNKESLEGVNAKLGLALQADEIEYILASWPRDPTDVELMMFAQVNSEHCRHKIFNASWTLDGKEAEHSLFQMIKNTYKCNPEGVLSAYSDNAAVLKGHTAMRFFPDPASKEYGAVEEPIHIVCKVETHNHPTAVSPFPGAATGVGGEIRDEGATGIGGKPKAGLTGFSVSHLLLPGAEQPWEDRTIGKPNRIASALQIMLDAPIGGARFNNEFGRPNVCGYFRSFLQDVGGQVKGYHKPIMLAGGLGNIRDQHLFKKKVGPGCHIVVLGGPAMLIGLGGGAASSMAQGASAEDVDFASVQRDNAELERRCQEVIDRCWELGDHNPILCIHDVGAGGLSNAIPEVLHDSGNGGIIHLRKVPNTEPGMSPMEVWCNEAQERYVIACNTEGLASLEAICQRERCIYAVVGETTAEQRLIVDDSLFGNTPVDLSMGTLFGKPPRVSKTVTATKPSIAELSVSASADEALHRVLANPTVASKSFLITIGDRTVTGLIARDQMVGKWQVPVADVAVTCSGYEGFTGEAMSCGERAPVAVIDGPSSAGLAIGEAITNILAADVRSLKDVRFSANWMVNSGSNEEDYSLYKTCEKIGMDLAPKLGICIPVGKDSMSMKSIWTDEKGTQKKVTAPLSVVITGFAPVTDVRKTWTPDLKRTGEETVLLLVQLGGENKRRLGGSVLAQTYSTMGNEAPCMGSTDHILAFAAATTTLRDQNLVLAYHDRSDGGWIVSVAEMCFAGRQGASISVQTDASVLAELFNEELGVVLQVSKANEAAVRDTLTTAGLPQDAVVTLGGVTKEQVLTVSVNGTEVIKRTRAELQRVWAEVSYRMQSLRDNAECAEQEYAAILDDEDPGLHCDLPFSIPKPIPVSAGAPRVAILREQGVNGHFEMANAFHTAGFVVADVHMSDILSGAATLSNFRGLACCGGFSFGDTFGAGRGWASTIKDNKVAAAEFSAFFNRSNTFTLGVCNGCQMLGSLSSMVPGAAHWPKFTYNASGQYEARVALVKVQEGATSIFFKGMAGAVIPAAVSHGEGRAEFRSEGDRAACQVPARYVDTRGRPTQAFPANPNGSPDGIAGVCSEDGRATIMMPHPERTLRTVANSWSPDQSGDASPWGDFSPWIQFFVNARKWCDQTTA